MVKTLMRSTPRGPIEMTFSASLRFALMSAWPPTSLLALPDNPVQGNEYIKCVVDDSIMMIIGSNAIEKVGGPQDVTYRLCREIFWGNAAASYNYSNDELEEEHDAELDHATFLGRSRIEESIIQGRHEILQHAEAFHHLVESLVVEEAPLTEDLIKSAHEILMKHSEEEETGGVYRTSEEGAAWGLRIETDEEFEKRTAQIRKYKPNETVERLENIPKYRSKFVKAQAVEFYMKKLVDEFNEDVRELHHAEESALVSHIDAATLAAKYAHYFVCIHPFEDGNGRMCRLLMNCILLRYGRICVEIGVNVEVHEEYIRIVNAGNKLFAKEESKDVEWRDQTCFEEFAEYITRRSMMAVQRINQILAG